MEKKDEKFLQEAGRDVLIELIQEVRDKQMLIFDQLSQNAVALKEHAAADERMMEKFLCAFPKNDMDSHRRYHESIIAWMELRNDLIKHCLKAAAAAGSIGAIGWILYALWTAAKMEVMRP